MDSRGGSHALHISTILTGSARLRGVMNGQGWVVVALFALFGSARIYYGFVAPALTPQPAGSAQ